MERMEEDQRCEIERKTTNGMDGRCVKSVELKKCLWNKEG